MTAVEYVISLRDNVTNKLKVVQRHGDKLDRLFGREMPVALKKTMHAFGRMASGAATSMQFAAKAGKGLLIGMTAIIAAGALLGAGVIQNTATYEKQKATLTNTFQSSDKAAKSMAMIADIAAKTPFQIDGLTDSYVKLVNRGFEPTRKQIMSMGDLAASQGKDFDQLAEAILDAETGEFERLKEFGIKANKHGKQVTMTFKGVKTEVENTAEGIRAYTLGLGDMVGVTGGMDAVSATLGGKLSNLEDVMTQLSIKTGLAISPIMIDTIDQVIAGVDKLTPSFIGFVQKLAPYFKKFIDGTMKGVWSLIENWHILKSSIMEVATPLLDLSEIVTDLLSQFDTFKDTGSVVAGVMKVLAWTFKITSYPIVILIETVSFLLRKFREFAEFIGVLDKEVAARMGKAHTINITRKVSDKFDPNEKNNLELGLGKDKKGGAAGSKDKGGKESSVSVSGAAPKIFNLNITKFQDQIVFNNTTMKEAPQAISDSITNAIMKALVDVQNTVV